jgi:hypothetical protein
MMVAVEQRAVLTCSFLLMQQSLTGPRDASY